MQKEQIRDFSRRLSQCNSGEMIVIMYDIYFAYIEDVLDAHKKDDYEAFKDSIHKAQRTLNELIGALDFSYPIAENLYSLYTYCRNCLSRALYENRTAGIEEAQKVMRPLYESFTQVAAQDQSKPLMSNAQQVYAGITYGKGTLNENMTQSNDNRGFLA